MTSRSAFRSSAASALLTGVICTAALLASPDGAWAAKKKPAKAAEPVAAAPVTPVAAVTSVGSSMLAGRVIEAASAYRAYMRRTAALTAAFSDGRGVETALEAAESSDPQGLSQGVIAYAAILALQDDAFTSAVRGYGVDPAQRRLIADRITADPAYATVLPGAASAAAIIIRTLNADGARVAGVGQLVKQSAYDIQKKAWSKQEIPDRPGRLAHAKTLAAGQMSASPADIAELAAAASLDRGSHLIEAAGAGSASPPYTPLVARALSIAALATLGMGGDDNGAQVQSLLNESSGAFCHNMAKLNLYQCLAVAKPFYEDVFCLGQHVLIDTGQCVSKGAGAASGGATASAPAALDPLQTSTASGR